MITSKTSLELGLSLFDARRWAEAVTALEQADAETPSSAAAYWLAQARFELARNTPLTDPMTVITRWQAAVKSLHAARQVASTRVEVDVTLLAREAATARSGLLTALQTIGGRATQQRATSLAQLATLMAQGYVPDPIPDGRLRGLAIAFALQPAVDALSHWVARRWLPWEGKVFHRNGMYGDNILDKPSYGLAHFLFPKSILKPDTPITYRSFDFRLVVGPGIVGTAPVLKLDYDQPTNPGFIVRQVVDELVAISDDVYLGRAFLRTHPRAKRWHLAVYFALTPQ